MKNLQKINKKMMKISLRLSRNFLSKCNVDIFPKLSKKKKKIKFPIIMHIRERSKTFSHSVDNKTFKRLTSKVKKLPEKEKLDYEIFLH
jgi:hypothetical protein